MDSISHEAFKDFLLTSATQSNFKRLNGNERNLVNKIIHESLSNSNETLSNVDSEKLHHIYKKMTESKESDRWLKNITFKFNKAFNLFTGTMPSSKEMLEAQQTAKNKYGEKSVIKSEISAVKNKYNCIEFVENKLSELKKIKTSPEADNLTKDNLIATINEWSTQFNDKELTNRLLTVVNSFFHVRSRDGVEDTTSALKPMLDKYARQLADLQAKIRSK
jgi:hypothetical protein